MVASIAVSRLQPRALTVVENYSEFAKPVLLISFVIYFSFFCDMKIILTALFALCFCTVRAQTDTAVYFNPEITAVFPGGQNAWFRYLVKNLRYPGVAVRKNIQGTVVAQFMVDSTGVVHDVSAVSGPEELRAETIRLVQNVTWFPAVNNGKKVNSWKTQSISFKLE
jgi:periplasmic protein TonB